MYPFRGGPPGPPLLEVKSAEMPEPPILDAVIRPPEELRAAWERHPEIVKLGDPMLRKVARPITRFTQETHELIRRMSSIMKEANGLGLAAPQVGVSMRIVVYDAGDGLRVLINPRVVHSKGEQTEPAEGCLSVPGLQGTVARAKEIRVKAFDQRGKPLLRRMMDLEARVVQHEIDHLDGILFFDRADPETLVWLTEEQEEQQEELALQE